MIDKRTNERIRISRHLPTAHFVVEKSLANCERMVWYTNGICAVF